MNSAKSIWVILLINKKDDKTVNILGVYTTKLKAQLDAKSVNKEIKGMFSKGWRELEAIIEKFELNKLEEILW